jgi:hypothetical protein
MKAYGEVDVIHCIVTSALERCECLASRPWRLTHGGKAPGAIVVLYYDLNLENEYQRHKNNVSGE